MLGRKSLVSTFLLICSLASVPTAPIRTSGCTTVSPRPDCLRCNFALPLDISPTYVGSALITDAVLKVDAPPSESEEQDLAENEEQDLADPVDEQRVTFLLPCSFRKIPHRRLIPPPSILSVYPLRC